MWRGGKGHLLSIRLDMALIQINNLLSRRLKSYARDIRYLLVSASLSLHKVLPPITPEHTRKKSSSTTELLSKPIISHLCVIPFENSKCTWTFLVYLFNWIKRHFSSTFFLSIHSPKTYSSILSQSKVKCNFIFNLFSVLELAKLLALLFVTVCLSSKTALLKLLK